MINFICENQADCPKIISASEFEARETCVTFGVDGPERMARVRNELSNDGVCADIDRLVLEAAEFPAIVIFDLFLELTGGRVEDKDVTAGYVTGIQASKDGDFSRI